jgi:polysaccharide export outer membrane protein
MKCLKNHWVSFGLAATLIFSLSCCTPYKHIVYFHDLDDTVKIHIQDSIQSFEAHVQPGDVLNILVSSDDAAASAPFNPGGSSSPATTGTGTPIPTSSPRGYRVDLDSTIDFPVLGKIRAAGQSIAILRDTLTARLRDYLKDPHVSIQYTNYKVTLLGEVGHPGSLAIPDGKATLLDALAQSGDLTIYGKRTNITVIREEGGRRVFAKLDLTSSQVFRSPYFYLHQNDVIYVAPNKSKSGGSDDRFARNLGLGTGILAVVLSLAYLLK